jgi:hypothetical protein
MFTPGATPELCTYTGRGHYDDLLTELIDPAALIDPTALASPTFASWNLISPWLARLDGLRRAA